MHYCSCIRAWFFVFRCPFQCWSVEADIWNKIVEARAVSDLVDPASLLINGEEAVDRAHQDDAKAMGKPEQINDGEQCLKLDHSALGPSRRRSHHVPEAEPVAFFHPREPKTAAVLRRGEHDALVMGRRG